MNKLRKILSLLLLTGMCFALYSEDAFTFTVDKQAPEWLKKAVAESNNAPVKKALNISKGRGVKIISYIDEKGGMDLASMSFVQFLFSLMGNLCQEYGSAVVSDNYYKNALQLGSTRFTSETVHGDNLDIKISVANSKLPLIHTFMLNETTTVDAAQFFTALYSACPEFFGSVKNEYVFEQNVTVNDKKENKSKKTRNYYVIYSFDESALNKLEAALKIQVDNMIKEFNSK